MFGKGAKGIKSKSKIVTFTLDSSRDLARAFAAQARDESHRPSCFVFDALLRPYFVYTLTPNFVFGTNRGPNTCVPATWRPHRPYFVYIRTARLRIWRTYVPLMHAFTPLQLIQRKLRERKEAKAKRAEAAKSSSGKGSKGSKKKTGK